jgi:hypothetical protein
MVDAYISMELRELNVVAKTADYDLNVNQSKARVE